MNNEFICLNDEELMDLNGGWVGIAIAIVGGVVVVLAGDHLLEKYTGRDAVEWVGYGLDQAGQGLQNFGHALMN